MIANDVFKKAIAEFGRKYLWWKPVGATSHSDDRVIAQTMNLERMTISFSWNKPSPRAPGRNHAACRAGLVQ
jgi:hypothetical protein